ncbi:MAG: deoxynucleoside kinase [Oscillospiraceae bacterium]|nr:deoxynucleoside kinase [Oscillospiraceae bacterium]
MLIVFEGVDSSGKETHSRKVYERLISEGHIARKISFPNYESRAAGAINMYLNGEFGKNPEDVNPFAASTFYAIDRFASFKQYWEAAITSGEIVIADRYTTSNMIHQGAKIKDDAERAEYVEWLCDLEFTRFKLPKPDKVIFLDMPMEFRMELLKDRKEKDIHESDAEYMRTAHLCAQKMAKEQSWEQVSIVKNGKLRTIEDVHNEVYSIVLATMSQQRGCSNAVATLCNNVDSLETML